MRNFNVYGPRSRTTGVYGAVFGVFLAQKLHGKPFTVVGDGTQTRDFVYVTDVCRAFLAAAEAECTGEVFNVGHRQAAERQPAGGADRRSEITRPRSGPGSRTATWADISKIRRVLGWEPKVSFEEGVATMLGQIEHWREAPVWTVDSIAEATETGSGTWA